MADEIDAKVLARRQKDLAGFTEEYEKLVNYRALKFGDKIAPIWKRTAQRLDKDIRALLLQYSNPDGTLSEAKLKTLGYKIASMDKLRQSIRSNLGETVAPITEGLGNGIGYEYTRAYNYAAYGLEQAAKVAITVPQVTAAQVMGIVNNPWLADGKNYSDRIRQNTQYLADKMYNSIGRGVTEGWDVNKTAREIQRVAGEGYFNSVRLARTEFTRAASQGASQLYVENSDVLDGKRWNATLDSRTAARDAKNDGKVYRLEYDTPESPGKPGERIPNHPHCRCRWTPILSALGISTKERIARGTGDTADNFGERIYTKARTYEEYAKERGLPDLNERLASEKPATYLRAGESFGATVGKVYTNPTPAAAVVVTTAAAAATTYTPLNDIKKATAWAKDNLPIDYVDYKGFDPKFADEINAGVQQLYTRYPEMKGRTKFMATSQERNRQYTKREVDKVMTNYLESYKGKPLPFTEEAYRKAATKRIKPKPTGAHTVAESTTKAWGPQEGIGFNEKFAKDYALMEASNARSVQSGWHPAGTENPVSNFTHEFGHQIDNLITEKDQRAELNALWDKWRKDTLATRRGTIAEAETLSKYAATNSKEFIAEGFSEYIHNPNPRPVAKAIGQAIEKAFENIREAERANKAYLKSPEYLAKLKRRGLD
ncbi:phage minor head protein [Pelosinus fermentans]|uniref:Head morphogenesis protein SPP1 gp7 n=2 Tax=Pelosinus TaxID=365348 RepID=I8RJ09_9FIRM|nr:phage minor head protein [Pelosinus fermentans]EIW19923.1 head morphogenesis protein SPP1 gp7 [Pelosinus fermentans B4]EIW21220.1 phage head morphogenesis protein, SPP1 gp7 family [Pelosinus fermentans A11]